MFIANIRRPEAGFEWAERADGYLARSHDPTKGLPGGPWLIPHGPFTKSTAVLRMPKLLEDFINAGHRPSPQAFLSLANRYGPLYDPVPVAPPGSRLPPIADSYQAWEAATRRVAVLAWLWRHILDGDTVTLSSFVEWQHTPPAVHIQLVEVAGEPLAEVTRRFWRDRQGNYRVTDGSFQSIPAAEANTGFTDEDRLRALVGQHPGAWASSTTMAIGEATISVPKVIMDEWSFGDVIAPLAYFVTSHANDVLARHVKFQIMHDGRNSPGLVPDSLYAAVFVKLAEWISGDGSYVRRCQNPSCGRLFRTNRKDKKSCTDSCRATKSRHVQKASANTTNSP